jgi:hypothetical protein
MDSLSNSVNEEEFMATQKNSQKTEDQDHLSLDVAEGQRDEVEQALEKEDHKHFEQMRKERKLDHKTEVNIH